MSADLFPGTRPPRAVPRKLLHVCDASPNDYDDGLATVRMSCTRCDHVSNWIYLSVTEAKRGIPCPNCNKETP